MCGIAGLIFDAPRGVDKALVDIFEGGLRHRGPDDFGCVVHGKSDLTTWEAGNANQEFSAVLIHRRLSILDLSEAGHQPMVSSDGRYALVFNGEIYNYVELRAILEDKGFRFRSRSDTEVLLYAYAAWGVAALPRLVGMFALAVLDRQRRELVLARDPFGIKPLYYSRWRDGWVFSSEIKPLLSLPGVGRAANAKCLYDYLRHGTTDHDHSTMFADVNQLPPAHHCVVALDEPTRPEPKPYWSIDLENRAAMSFEAAAERLRSLFLDSVRLHLRSDVPVGFALSGGIDSSAIVMAVRALEPNLDLHSFSFIAKGNKLSEEYWVDLIGSEARLTPHKAWPRPEDLVRDLDDLIRVQEQPFGSTSIYAQYCVFRLAHEAGIKVMLDGQGADELLAGYRNFLAARLASLVSKRRWSEAGCFYRNVRNGVSLSGLQLLQRVGALMLPDRFRAVAKLVTGHADLPGWMNGPWFRERSVSPTGPWDKQQGDVLRRLLHQSLTRSSLPMLLRYEDRNSMAFSIESRVPFLTIALAEFILSLPEEYLIGPDGQTKSIFRRAMRGLVPDPVLDRKDKVGFATPEREWLSALRPWVESVLFGPDVKEITPLNDRWVRHGCRRAFEGRGQIDARIWRWINVIRWAALFQVSFE